MCVHRFALVLFIHPPPPPPHPLLIMGLFWETGRGARVLTPLLFVSPPTLMHLRPHIFSHPPPLSFLILMAAFLFFFNWHTQILRAGAAARYVD